MTKWCKLIWIMKLGLFCFIMWIWPLLWRWLYWQRHFYFLLLYKKRKVFNKHIPTRLRTSIFVRTFFGMLTLTAQLMADWSRSRGWPAIGVIKMLRTGFRHPDVGGLLQTSPTGRPCIIATCCFLLTDAPLSLGLALALTLTTEQPTITPH